MSNQNPKYPQTPLEKLDAEAAANANRILGPNSDVLLDLVCHCSTLSNKKSVSVPEALALFVEAAGRMAATRQLSLDECLETFKKAYEASAKRSAS